MGVNMNENCKGCGNLGMGREECFYTKIGIREFPNCVCSSCLIKSVCHSLCDDFYRMIKKKEDIALGSIYLRSVHELNG